MSALMPSASFRATHVSPSSRTILPKRMPRAYMFGMLITYSPSCGRPPSTTRFSPSIVVLTLFPRNLDLGRSSPMIVTRFAGDV
jgi:hypothetical protein